MLVRNLLLALGILTLVVGVALFAILFSQTSSRSVSEAKAPPVVRPAIMVAARAIGTGTLLRAEDVTWRDAETDIRPGSLLRGQDAEFLGAVARRDFAVGDPLIASDFVKPNERGFLAAVLKPGARAVSIVVDASQSSSGLILPGDRIDVVLIQSFGDTAEPAHKEVAETVLFDVRVIAVDQSLNAATRAPPAERRVGSVGSPEAQLPKTFSLEVSPRQAEKLFVASQLGRLGLSVRALEGGGVPDVAPAGRVGPTWASDVSPALREFRERQQHPVTTGSSIERSIRTVPPLGTTLSAPAATDEGIVVPNALLKRSNTPVGTEGVAR
jgi:pilus assembly protein CpaB